MEPSSNGLPQFLDQLLNSIGQIDQNYLPISLQLFFLGTISLMANLYFAIFYYFVDKAYWRMRANDDGIKKNNLINYKNILSNYILNLHKSIHSFIIDYGLGVIKSNSSKLKSLWWTNPRAIGVIKSHSSPKSKCSIGEGKMQPPCSPFEAEFGVKTKIEGENIFLAENIQKYPNFSLAHRSNFRPLFVDSV
jgi:hypothetical protein